MREEKENNERVFFERQRARERERERERERGRERKPQIEEKENYESVELFQ